ncbi:MAG: PLP-dependent aminotransferase family protein [Thalassobaculaceae bacterium]|nr:PLP-dependent aminotransferase family protein [Thalassobaculaceae bacterium]
MPFDFAPLLNPKLPPAAARFGGFPKYNFVGGHNDASSIPAQTLADAVSRALLREGQTLATYGMQSGPQGYRPLREEVAKILERRAGMKTDPDDVLITGGSLQAMDLVNNAFLEPGDTVIIEEACYGGAMTKLRKLGVDWVGVPVDQDGMRMDALAETLDRLKAAGKRVKFIYTIPTVQNPTGTVLSLERRHAMLKLAEAHGIAIFEDDCYCDLIFDGPYADKRPPAIRALDDSGRVVYCGSFSKSIAPALRVGYVVADWPLLSRILAQKSDGGTGAVEQMLLAEFAKDFDAHVDALNAILKGKAEALVEALEAEFGTAAEFTRPTGGIFLWVTLPVEVDTTRLAQVAAAEGVAVNPGAEWSADAEAGKRRIRICFAHPPAETIKEGMAKLAEICHREFGVPVRRRNVERS